MDSLTPDLAATATTAAARNKRPRRNSIPLLALLVSLALVGFDAGPVGAAKTKAKAKAKAKRPPIQLVTNVRQSSVRSSTSFVRLGSFDSKRPKMGEITVECKGGQEPACRMTSSVAGPLRLKNGGAMNSAQPTAAAQGKGKGKDRTPGGVGGGGGGGGGNTQTSAPKPTTPPNTGIFDFDVEWNPCFFDDSLCFEISYDMGGDGVVAQPDGSGDTVDGQQGDINIGKGSPKL